MTMLYADDGDTPQQRLATSHARSVEQLAHVQIPLYGLPADWPGTRMTGSTCFERGVERSRSGPPLVETHETVELVHEDGRGRVSVESSDHSKSLDDAALAERLESEAGQLSTVTVDVEGRPRTFATARDGDRMVARWAGDGLTITIEAEHWTGSIELVRITDLAPYHDGRRRRLEQRSGYRLG